MPTPTITYRINLALGQADYDRLAALMARWQIGQAATIRRALELAHDGYDRQDSIHAEREGSKP